MEINLLGILNMSQLIRNEAKVSSKFEWISKCHPDIYLKYLEILREAFEELGGRADKYFMEFTLETNTSVEEVYQDIKKSQMMFYKIRYPNEYDKFTNNI